MEEGRRNTGWLLAVLVVLAIGAAGQEASPSPVLWNGFQTQGEATAGFRFTDVKGYVPTFKQLFDLNTGPRLEDTNVFGIAAPNTHLFADRFSLSASGLGGDPFPTAQLRVSKTGLYDFRTDWRQSYYYWNQNDTVVLPAGQPGLTPNQNWATVRKFGNASLVLHASNRLRFTFNYYRTSNSGAIFATESPDFLGSPSYWGTYARGNPYELFQPILDETNRFTGGLDATLGAWTVHYSLGYQTFDEAINPRNLSSPQFSIDTGQKLNGQEPLLNFAQSETRQLRSPVSEFSYTGPLSDKIEYRGDYIFYRFIGPASFVENFNGIAPGSTGVLAPYQVSQSGQSQVSEPQHVLDQGLTYTFNPGWNASLDYRLMRFSSHSSGTFTSLLNNSLATTVPEQLDWNNGLQEATLSMRFAPTADLLISPGVRLSRQDLEQLEFGVADPATSLTTKTVWPELGFYYRPTREIKLRGSVHAMNAGASYTAISPHTRTGGSLQASWAMGTDLTLDNNFEVDNAKQLASGFVSRVRSNSTALSYAAGARLSLFGGFTYESDFAAGNILYARGTPPLSDFLRDQTVNRVIQGGLEAGPFQRVGVRLTGNFDRTTGIGQISGEPPGDGPLVWPLITGTIYVDVPRAGRLSLDLQRTYFVEQIVAGNNFSAEMLTVRWTRAF